MWTEKEERQTFENGSTHLSMLEATVKRQIYVQTQEMPLPTRHDGCSMRLDSQAHNSTNKKGAWPEVLVFSI